MIALPSWRRAASHATLAVVACAVAVPLLFTLKASFVPSDQVLSDALFSWPSRLTLENYRRGFDAAPFPRYFLNSALISGTITACTVMAASAAGYGFAQFAFPGRRALFTATIAGMLIPLQAIIIPLFIEVKQLGWIDSYVGLIVPGAISAFGVFMMRQFMLTIPRELLEAARVDGCGEMRIFVSVVLPLAIGPMAALAALTFVASWNNFLWPLLIAQRDAVATVPLGLVRFRGAYLTDYGPIFAMSILSALPPVLLFLIMRRRIMASFSTTGLK